MPKKREIEHNILEEMQKLYDEEQEDGKQQNAEKPLKIKQGFDDAVKEVIHNKG